MYVYVFLIILVVILWQTETTKNSDKALRDAFIIIFVLFAFRSYDVGVDTPRYIEGYLSGESYLRGIDYGYAAYSSFLLSLGFSSRCFLALSSFIMLMPFFLYIKKAGMPRLFTVLLYITIGTFSMQLSGLRQSMAVSIVIMGVALSMELNRRWLQFLILTAFVLVAQSFHHTGMVGFLFIPFFLLMERRFFFKKFWLFILALLPLALFFTSNIFAPIVNQLTVDRYENYEIGSESINIIAFFVIPYFMFLYTLWLTGNVGLDSRYERIGFMCSLLYMICASASLYMPILARIENYFSLPMLVLITQLTSKTSPNVRKPLFFLIGFVCIVFFFVSTSGGILQIDNYKFSIE